MISRLLGKPKHRPYLALRAPAEKMIRRKQLPTIENLRNEISITSAIIAIDARAESGRRKFNPVIPKKPSMSELLAKISHDITLLQPIIKGKKMTVEQLAERATVYRLIKWQGAGTEDVIALFKDKDAARALWQRAEAMRG